MREVSFFAGSWGAIHVANAILSRPASGRVDDQVRRPRIRPVQEQVGGDAVCGRSRAQARRTRRRNRSVPDGRERFLPRRVEQHSAGPAGAGMTMRTGVSITDRIGNGIVAGFIATLMLSALHEPVTLVTESVGVRAPVAGLLFHFFVGTLLWGSVFGFVHDYLFGPSWLRGVVFASAAALIVMFGIAPLTG